MAFEQGKQKLAKLEQLAQLKEDLSAIKKIELPKEATKEQSWKNYYNYLFGLARALRPIFQSDIQGENKLVALLKETGCFLHSSSVVGLFIVVHNGLITQPPLSFGKQPCIFAPTTTG